MRRRERWLNLAWVQSLPSDNDGVVAERTFDHRETTDDLLHALTNRYLRYVEMERDGEFYRIRLLPIAHIRGIPTLDVGMSYACPDIRPALFVAKQEIAAIANNFVVPCVGKKEVFRWVK